MNNFTKKELLLIHEAFIYLYSDNNAGNVEILRKLNLKIKDMIDNYCEHIPQKDVYVYADVCSTCNKILKQVNMCGL